MKTTEIMEAKMTAEQTEKVWATVRAATAKRERAYDHMVTAWTTIAPPKIRRALQKKAEENFRKACQEEIRVNREAEILVWGIQKA